jgi:hypothetical protein
MIRRILDFVLILLFVWVCMILGLWVIDRIIVPMQLPRVADGLLTGMVKISVSAGLVLFWLWLWREIVKKMFWRAMDKQ